MINMNLTKNILKVDNILMVSVVLLSGTKRDGKRL